MFFYLITRFQFVKGMAEEKKDRLEYSKRPLSIAGIMTNGDTCPQGTFNAAVVANLRYHYPGRIPAEHA
jgi:hypothetical protein